MTHITPIRRKMVIRNQNGVRPNGMTEGCIENIDAASAIGYNTLSSQLAKLLYWSYLSSHTHVENFEVNEARSRASWPSKERRNVSYHIVSETSSSMKQRLAKRIFHSQFYSLYLSCLLITQVSWGGIASFQKSSVWHEVICQHGHYLGTLKICSGVCAANRTGSRCLPRSAQRMRSIVAEGRKAR